MSRARPRYDASRNQWRIKLRGRWRYLCSGADAEDLAWENAKRLKEGMGDGAELPSRPRSVVQAALLWLRLKQPGSAWHRAILAPFMEWAVGQPLGDVPADYLEDYMTSLRGRYAAETIRKQVSYARAVLRWAGRRGYLKAEVPELPRLPRSATKDRSYTPLAAGDILSVLPAKARRLVQFIALTGCRPEEACRLRWAEQRDSAVFELHRGKTFERTGEPRVILLSEEAERLLAEGPRESEYVFTSRLGKPYTSSGLRSILRRAGEKVGVKVTGAYQFRHTWAQTASDRGLSMDDIGKALGHAQGSRITRHYARVTQRRALEAVRRHTPLEPKHPLSEPPISG